MFCQACHFSAFLTCGSHGDACFCRRFHFLRSTTGQRRTRRRRPNNRIATSRSDPSGACNVLQLPPPLPAAADLSCRWAPTGSKKAAPVLGTGAPPCCPDAWGLTCPIGRDCLATVADGAAAHAGPFPVKRAKNRVQQAALGGLLHNRNSCRGGVATVGASPTPSLDNPVVWCP